jgi:hypothetical protein
MDITPKTASDFSTQRVEKTAINDDVFVSTIFLGIDMRFGMAAKPLLFETMVFGGPLSGTTTRYCSWDDAVAGHSAIVEWAKKSVSDKDGD